MYNPHIHHPHIRHRARTRCAKMWWFRWSPTTLQQEIVAGIRQSNVGDRVSQAVYERWWFQWKCEKVSYISRSFAGFSRRKQFGNGASERVVFRNGWVGDVGYDGSLDLVTPWEALGSPEQQVKTWQCDIKYFTRLSYSYLSIYTQSRSFFLPGAGTDWNVT